MKLTHIYNVCTVDVGRTAVKTIRYDVSQDIIPTSTFEILGNLKGYWNTFEVWLAAKLQPCPNFLAIAVPGILDNCRKIVLQYASIESWRLRPIYSNLELLFPKTKILLLGDGEAHLWGQFESQPHPNAVCLTFGTSVAVARTDWLGNVIGGDSANLSNILLTLDDHTERVGYVLGSDALKKLYMRYGIKNATIRFSKRILVLIKYVVKRWGPSSVFLSGGLMESHHLKDSVDLIIGNQVQGVEIRVNPHSQTLGLQGLARAAQEWLCV